MASSDKRTAANRENARRSTGPRTPEGKHRARRNGITHGLTTTAMLLDDEDTGAYNALVEEILADLDPATEHERALALNVANTIWRRDRLYGAEVAFLNLRARSLQAGNTDLTTSLEAVASLFFDAEDIARMRLLARYLTNAERACNKAVEAYWDCRNASLRSQIEEARLSEALMERKHSALLADLKGQQLEPLLPPSAPPQANEPTRATPETRRATHQPAKPEPSPARMSPPHHGTPEPARAAHQPAESEPSSTRINPPQHGTPEPARAAHQPAESEPSPARINPPQHAAPEPARATHQPAAPEPSPAHTNPPRHAPQEPARATLQPGTPEPSPARTNPPQHAAPEPARATHQPAAPEPSPGRTNPPQHAAPEPARATHQLAAPEPSPAHTNPPRHAPQEPARATLQPGTPEASPTRINPPQQRTAARGPARTTPVRLNVCDPDGFLARLVAEGKLSPNPLEDEQEELR